MAKLRLAGIHKSFDSTQALKDVSFSAESGEVLALCGENGAGKSTLIKILSGAVQPDRGDIFVDGSKVEIETPRQAIGLGIHTVHQELSLLPHLSVAENLLLGRMPHRRAAWMIDWTATRDSGASRTRQSRLREHRCRGADRFARRLHSADRRNRQGADRHARNSDPGRADGGAVGARDGHSLRQGPRSRQSAARRSFIFPIALKRSSTSPIASSFSRMAWAC